MIFDLPMHPYWLRSLQMLGTLTTADPFGRRFLFRMDALFNAMRSQGAVWQFQQLRQALMDVGWDELTAEDIADHAEKIMLGNKEPQVHPAGAKVWDEIATELMDEVKRGELIAWKPRPIPVGYTAGPRPSSRNSIPPLIAELRKLGAEVEVSTDAADDVAVTNAEASLGFAFPEWLKEFYRHHGSIEWFWGVELEEDDSLGYRPDADHQHVYALSDALRRVESYERVFSRFVECTELPKRFIVISEADEDNEAWGFVYDADRDALLRVMGGKGIAATYEGMTIWQLLRDLLTISRDQLRAARGAE